MSGQDILKAEARLLRATLDRDLRTLQRLIHPSFVFLGLRSAGLRSWTRAQWIDAARQIGLQKLEQKVRDLQMFPGTAVLTLEGSWEADLRGKAFAERLLMTDVWVKTGPAAWALARRHSTRYVEDEAGIRGGAALELE